VSAESRRILRIGLISLGSLAVVLTVAGIFIARTARFRDYVRARIVEAVEDATGGRADIGVFAFDGSQLRAEIRDFVLHGTEPAGSEPLFRASDITVQLRPSSIWWRGRIELRSVTIKQPQTNLIVFPDGTTNIPEPKLQHRSDKTSLQTVVDLSIGRFEIDNGSIQFAGQRMLVSASGKNLSARFLYEAAGDEYRGQISMNPLFVQSGANPRLEVNLNVPVVLRRDHIELANAVISTGASKLQVDGTIDHLVSPNVLARAQGHIDMQEVKRTLAGELPLNTAKDAPHSVDINADVNTHSEAGTSNAHLILGQSSFDISGTFRNLAALQGSVQFTSSLALNELARILQLSFNAGGALRLAGNAVLNGSSNYTVDADITGRNLEYRKGDVRISNVGVSSQIAADPHTVSANPVQATWSGGKLDGRAALRDFARYRVDGTLSGFDLQQIAAQLTAKRIGYGGTISGSIEAEGGVKTSQSRVEMARARIAIAPKSGGVPMRGQINVSYNGPAGTADLGQSFIALPSSRLDLSGAIGKEMTAHFVSRNLDDFRPVAVEMPVRFDAGGSALVDAKITGQVSMARLLAHATISRFAIEQRHFDLLTADLNAQSDRATLRNGTLTHGALNAQFKASVGLDEWKTAPSEPLEASLSMRNADVMDVLALAQESNLPVRGSLTLSAEATGILGNPQGSADVAVTNGEAYGQPIDWLNGRVTFGGQVVTIPALQVSSGMSQVDLNATFQHPLNEFSTGTLHAHVNAGQVTLARLEPVHQRRPDLDGDIQFNIDADAILEPPSAAERIRLVSANGSVSAGMLRMKGERLGDLAARIQTSGNVVSYRVDSNFAGAAIRADGRTNLTADHEIEANVDIRNLPIEKALEVAGEKAIPARGILSANGLVVGTIRDPRANFDVSLAKAAVMDQPIDQLQGHIDYASTLVNVPSLSVQAGPNRLTANASFTHPARNFATGNVKLHLDSNTLQLAQVRYLQQMRPGLAGSLQVNVDGAAALNDSKTEPHVMLSSLNAKISANGIRASGKDLGGFTATAEQTGSMVRVNLDSNLAQSIIRLTGQAQLTRDYPVNAQLNFDNIRYSNLRGLLGPSNVEDRWQDFDALLEGSVNVDGPAISPMDLTGSAQISKLEVTRLHPGALHGGATPLTLLNDGPITLVANQSGIQVQRARIIGPSTEIAITGNVAVRPVTAFNVNVNADTDLALIRQIDKSISSSGAVTFRAAITGSPSQPVINGRLELKHAAYQQVDWPNGLANANGAIVFTGTTARIDSLTAETGGGQITANGNVTRTGSGFAFNLQSRATRVLVRTDAGVSVTANANFRLSGTNQSSILGGDVTIVSVGFNPQSDFASLLKHTAAPMETGAAPKGLLANMNVEVAVRMAPGAVFQSAYTQGLQAQADLKVRGNVLNPGMIGRVNVTQGNLVFFGTKYNINEGSVTFYNPYKIEPILDLSLETNVQSVDVVLTVTGPVENMNLAYHSDPPLQFSEIVALLGEGRTSTSDPVLVAHQPQTPPQSMTDMGASALLGAAVANPVAGQLQRVFGVSQLKIAPTFVTGSTLPQAQATLQQQVAQNLVFTYVTDLSQPDSQIIRIEWAMNQQWSAVASRESNGVVGVEVFYKRRFR
jgi:translocation and assembly module TamB